MQRWTLIGLALFAFATGVTAQEKTEEKPEPRARLKIERVPNTSGHKLVAKDASVGTVWEDRDGTAWRKEKPGSWKPVHRGGWSWCDALAEQNCVRVLMDPDRGEARYAITGTDIRDTDKKPFPSLRDLLTRVLNGDPDEATWRYERTKEGFTVWVPYERAKQTAAPLKEMAVYGEKDLTVTVKYGKQLGEKDLPHLLETMRAVAPNVLGYRSSAVKEPVQREGFRWEFTVVKNKRRR